MLCVVCARLCGSWPILLSQVSEVIEDRTKRRKEVKKKEQRARKETAEHNVQNIKENKGYSTDIPYQTRRIV